MITSLKPYPAYKDSGLPWLGQVPGHWEVIPNRALFNEVNDRNHPGEEMLSVTITKGIVKQKALLEGSSKKDSSKLDRSAYKLVQPRDIAYNKMRAWQGAIGASAMRGIISPAYVVMRLRSEYDLPSYFHHLYRTPQFAKEAERWSYGITSDMWSLRPEHFKMIYSPLPPPSEQAAIVRFLDWANGRLERAIRAKRKIIALLNEQKQAIIHKAVTRGLDPSVRLKPSGIPWLGEIPEHWAVRRLKNVCRVQGGYAFPSAAFGNTGIPVVRMNNLRRGVLSFNAVVRIPETECVSNFSLKAGDILYGLSGSIGATGSLGNYAVVTEHDLPAMLNQRVARFIWQRDKIDPSFLIQLIQSSIFYEQVLADTTGTAQFNVSTTDIENVAIGLPPLHEQAYIVSRIRESIAPLGTAISRLEREIELLREYRTRLVADVVTGKLDVREAAAKLPDLTPSTHEPALEASDESETDETEA
jgi:type I restriction enzyme S subunit